MRARITDLGRAFLNAMPFSFFQIAVVRRSRKRAGFNKQAARCAPGARFGVERPMTAPQPMLSVILPNYNHGTYHRACAEFISDTKNTTR
jgi:hypothetical protein